MREPAPEPRLDPAGARQAVHLLEREHRFERVGPVVAVDALRARSGAPPAAARGRRRSRRASRARATAAPPAPRPPCARARSRRAAGRPARPAACPASRSEASACRRRTKTRWPSRKTRTESDPARAGTSRGRSVRVDPTTAVPSSGASIVGRRRTRRSVDRAAPKRAWYGPGRRRSSRAAEATVRADASGRDIGSAAVDLDASAPRPRVAAARRAQRALRSRRS